ncbi:NAD(P)-dependent dehydrogenase (short-subunit alcohol dehydrogenase family) [Scopulibacillus darangshiensis]|uniref:NAD(P)-dependent dehydrogenase (Short-subunit alcohol dehydrogenase family) n=1 Tax=Scopulibacillus darangshiensis TaxID=442528 RepID=A0A4R2NHG3_9BACL|nr:SDR family NAD(P)-dependent oxidoreductase [Scopulibacillus darangshiensis]TCP20698.1 NAD(P)-dependent dehydrogenase (short-subunit alcohol dehydrogenase family) [Scopulibacillus darangshiensis]
MSHRLANKVAIVFGAGSDGKGWGNGKAAAVAYAREGASVVAVDLNREAVEQTCDVIRKENGVCRSRVADVTNAEQVAEAVRTTLEEFGKIDILHNNVGLAQMGDPIELPEEDWHKAINVNLTSVFLTMKHVLPHMVKNKSGAIVNISSLSAIRYTGYPYPAYNAAKAAVNQLTSSVALQYASYGIRVNAIMPGLIDTPLIYRQISAEYNTVEEMVAERNAQTPMGRMGSAWDVANAAVFLASDEANFITGVCLPVDGGQSVQCM